MVDKGSAHRLLPVLASGLHQLAALTGLVEDEGADQVLALCSDMDLATARRITFCAAVLAAEQRLVHEQEQATP